MSKLTVTVDDALEAMLPRMVLRVTATAANGKQHSVEIVDPLGHPDNPMQDTDIEEKFNAMAEPVLGPERCRRSLDAFWKVRDADNIGALFAMLDLKPQ